MITAENLGVIAAFITLVVGSQGVMMWRSERMLKVAQAEQAKATAAQANANVNHLHIDSVAQISSAVIELIAPLREELAEERKERAELDSKLKDAVAYITEVRADVSKAGIPVRPVPMSLRHMMLER